MHKSTKLNNGDGVGLEIWKRSGRGGAEMNTRTAGAKPFKTALGTAVCEQVREQWYLAGQRAAAAVPRRRVHPVKGEMHTSFELGG
ncbi:Hypothetical protein NTJ_02520 [Nesidiocoris tenuis]|uniref:Uncharacterized protein n=1 Tax=Nesidiocoris tenuis TaxID=355587 RepID=A0ABN7ABN9_9HEMI|nr:Hypothetical protein NTJ_02520 [Nesidiocoris tenuis]